MFEGLLLIMLGAFISFFDFQGRLVNENNYEIILEKNKNPNKINTEDLRPDELQAVPFEGFGNSFGDNSFGDSFGNNSFGDLPPLDGDLDLFSPSEPTQDSNKSVEPKRYGTVQGGQQFADKSPSDFIKH